MFHSPLITNAFHFPKSLDGPSRIKDALCLLSGAVGLLASCGNEFLLGFDFSFLASLWEELDISDLTSAHIQIQPSNQ